MNCVNIIGRLVRDPLVHVREGGEPLKVAKFSIAVPSGKRNGEGRDEADFINIVCFGRNADFVERYFEKGSRIAVTGKLKMDKYMNKETGKFTYSLSVFADYVEFTESKKKHDEAAAGEVAEFVPTVDESADAEETPFN